MSIQFVDLKAQYRALERDIRAAIDTVLDHGQFIMGPEVGQLETRLAEYTGARHAITCSSGTDALLMALMAYGIGPGDAVFTTPFTFIATAEVVSLLGATPVFVDIDARTFNIDPDKLEEAVLAVEHEGTLKPKGVIPVDLFGLPADYDRIMEIASTFGLFVLEDAAQSFGSTYKGRKACNLGHIAATSFFPAKPLGCYGDGGAVFTNDDEVAATLRSIRIHGKGTDKYDNIRIGLNARLDTLQAAILLPKLAAFPDELLARQRVADSYTEALSGIVETPVTPDDCTSAWAQYSVMSDVKASLQAALKESGIPTAVYYPKPLHQQSAYQHLAPVRLEVAERTSGRIFSLPMHPYLDTRQIATITDALVNAVRGRP